MVRSFNMVSAIGGLAYDLNIKIDMNVPPEDLKDFAKFRLTRMSYEYEQIKKFNSKEYKR